MPQPAKVTTGTAPDRRTAWQSVDRGADQGDIADRDGDRISVDLLGELRVRSGSRTLGPRELGGAKPRRVLLALLLHRGSPVSKDRLVSLLWGQSPPSHAKATLEAYVCVLRKRLHPSQSARASVITTVAGCYAIDMGRVDLDLVGYERLLFVALKPDTSAVDALPMLEQAMAMAESPLLAGEADSEWLDEVRSTHSLNVRRHLIAAANKVVGLPSDSAQRWARRALDGDPLDESASRALLASMEASGQHADGLQAYDQCRRLFAAELGCAPGPGLQELYVRLLRGANEDDAELSRLMEAVVRVHTASQSGAQPPITALGSGRHDATDQTGSVEQAWHALDQLLHRAARPPVPSARPGPRSHSRPLKTPGPQAQPVEAPSPQTPSQRRTLPCQSADPRQRLAK
jgi:DNA-binding SARP family transcriptional activator